MASLWHPLGRLVESFWLAFSAFERLEPQREPFQPRFYDLVSFLVPCRSNFVKSLRFLTELLKVVWFLSVCIFFLHVLRLILLLLPFLLLVCWLLRACERSEAERGRCWLDVWMDGWLDRLLDGCPLPLLLPFSWLASSGVRAQRSGARPLLAGCLDGCLDGWLDGLLDGCLLPLFHFIVLSVFACSGFERFWVDFGTVF